MQLTANGSQLASTLRAGSRDVATFANNTVGYANRIGQSFKNAYHHMNGFSMISKLAVAAGGYSLLTDALRRNLEFEKTLLDMKQTAQMTVKEAAAMRRLAIDAASGNMALPNEMAEGMNAFAKAGMKLDKIKPSIDEAARAAVAFRSTVEQIANLDFDLQDKLNLDPKDIKDAHNMLLYHAKSGRYEAAPMAMEAPKYLNSVASVGITGMKGLNFTGAMTQIQMKLAPSTQPGEVATFMEHGLGHITSERYVKGLSKAGIDVKKYMPGGKFYGEGGVQGAMDLAAEMKEKGLEDPFKLDKAGFRDMYTKKFWRQMMKYHSEIQAAMVEGDKAALDDMVGRDKAEIMASNYGKFKQMEITKAKGQVSDGAQSAVSAGASVTGWAAENPGTAIGAGAAALVAGRLLWKRVTGGGSGPMDKILGAAGKAGMPVMVTNWPAGMGGPRKASDFMSTLPGKAVTTGTAVAAGASVATTAAAVAVVAAPLVALYAGKKWQESQSGKEANARRYKLEIEQLERRINTVKAGDPTMAAGLEKQRDRQQALLEKMIAEIAKMNDRPIEVHIDAEPVAAAVNKANGRDSRRQ
ncbi:phage tail tape measure protein [Herminiimonas arsenitoxidans]|uniref:phage tail tape measure protein n=1 Tax=Herminiimonas arsenitoxidans TaxID=1809410 RepID=UPI0012FFB020|nr:phage tail tape measure protein [Herminiimonas arsenitoxidans]